MGDVIGEGEARSGSPQWEYRVIRVSVGPLTFQKYGPDTPAFEKTLNDWGKEGWEAFHVQAHADGEALLLFLKRPSRRQEAVAG